MTIQTCMAGSTIPIRKLIEQILTDRGHRIGEAPNPARCVDWYVAGPNHTCNLMIAEFTGPETIDMIDVLIERRHIRGENIAIFSLRNSKAANEVKDFGCLLLTYPFRMEKFIEWAIDSEKRCRRKAA